MKNVCGADEFAFFYEMEEKKWQIYDSYYDKRKILVIIIKSFNQEFEFFILGCRK